MAAAARPVSFSLFDYGNISFQNGKKYHLIAELNEGGYGTVYEAEELDTVSRVALKVSKYSLKDEANNHRIAAKCPHAMPFIEYAQNATFDDPFEGKRIVDVIVIPVLGFDMAEEFEGKPFPLHEVQKMASQLLTFLKAMKKIGRVHGDLKPHNLMWNKWLNHLTVLDFLFSNTKEEWGRHLQTIGYKSPEVAWLGEYGCEVDIWTVGQLMIEWYLGKRFIPKGLHSKDRKQNGSDMLRIMVDQFGPLPARWKETLDFPFPPGDVYKKYKRENWEKDIREAAVKRKDNVESFIELLKKMMVYEYRIGAKHALKHPFFKASFEGEEKKQES